MLAKRYIVRGRVQGVGFRWFVDHEARQLGLSGWVRNNLDGAVEVLAMGSEQQLGALRKKLEKGPRAARVDEPGDLRCGPAVRCTSLHRRPRSADRRHHRPTR